MPGKYTEYWHKTTFYPTVSNIKNCYLWILVFSKYKSDPPLKKIKIIFKRTYAHRKYNLINEKNAAKLSKDKKNDKSNEKWPKLPDFALNENKKFAAETTA